MLYSSEEPNGKEIEQIPSERVFICHDVSYLII
jgi:hypothetical protein